MNLDLLRQRADLLDRTRAFFKARGFLEVETPLAACEAIPERHIHLLRLADEPRWLQASPEMHHKRLLCAGSGPIFEVTRSFRRGDLGRLHNPEFTILEWYRPGDDLDAAMALTDELLREVLGAPPAKRTSYREAFERVLGVDPHNDSLERLRQVCIDRQPGAAEALRALDDKTGFPSDRDEWLNLLLSFFVEPSLGVDAPELLFHYPASQSALATTTVDRSGAEVAERFELYYRGVELANGYFELADAAELRERFARVNTERANDGSAVGPLPEKLLEAMTDPGLPACAGVALGFDRLVMVATGAEGISEVVAFSEFY